MLIICMDSEKLKKLYIDKQKSQREIAKITGYSQTMIRLLMKRYKIPSRNLSEAQKINPSNPWKNKTKKHKKQISRSLKGNKNKEGIKISEEAREKISKAQRTTGQGKNEREYKKLAKKLFDGKCQKCGKVEDGLCVHHKDGDHYNNNPENLSLVCRSCHMSIHRNRSF